MTQTDEKKRDSEVRDEMAKEYRRLHDRNDNPKVFHRLSYDNGWDDCKLHSPDVKALLDALEYYAHPEHYEETQRMTRLDPPGVLTEGGEKARNALARWRKGDS